MSDVPGLTDHEERALIYMYEANHERDKDKAPTISELTDLTDWSSKYYTRAWKRLQPQGLVSRKQDGKNTRLALTEKGSKVADKLLQINEVLEQ